MKIICVDDEKLVLERNMKLCRELPGLEDVHGFSKTADALSWLDANPADICLLDIDMPDMNGLQLAAKIKEKRPDAAVIFVTGYSHYALEAIRLHASGYLMKPITRDQLEKEVTYALSVKHTAPVPHIMVQTFGEFDLLVDGKPVPFKRSKAKELLAYLVDLRGGSVKAVKAFSVLYEDEDYDRAMQKQFYVIISSLRKALEDAGVSGIFEMAHGYLRVAPEKFDCDLYRFLDGDADTINQYRGVYMDSYSWASMTEGMLDRKLN